MQAHGKGVKWTGVFALAVLLAGCGTKVVEVGVCRLPASGQILPDVTKESCEAQQGNWGEEALVTAYALPPAGATVDSIPFSAWNNLVCGGETTAITVPVNPTSWIAWKIMWGAVDSVTAVANWDSISYQMMYDDTVPVDMSNSLAWRTVPYSTKCPTRTYTGVVRERTLYLRPFTTERKVTGILNFIGSLHDGFDPYARGTTASLSARFQPTN